MWKKFCAILIGESLAGVVVVKLGFCTIIVRRLSFNQSQIDSSVYSSRHSGFLKL